MRYLSLTLFVLSLSQGPLYATEIDSYSGRDPSMADSTQLLNEIMNDYLYQSVEEMNDLANDCDLDAFRAQLRYNLGGMFWSAYENAILSDPRLDFRINTRSDSIYRDFTIYDSPALYIANLGAVYRLGDWYIGSDKFGHFIETGYDYYQRVYDEGGSIEAAMQWGEESELGRFGLQTTGIYSYGDLTANYDGLLFWERVVANAETEDYFTPNVICNSGEYRVYSEFNWTEYAMPSWDEAQNCNGYKTQEMEDKVERRMRELGQERGLDYACPIKPDLCKDLVEHYGNIAKRLLTPRCFS